MEPQIQKKESKKPSAIFVAFCWIFEVYLFWLIITLFLAPVLAIREMEAHFFSYSFVLGFIPFLIFALSFQIIGFSLGIKRQGKALFIFPFLSAMVPLSLFIFLCFIIPGAGEVLLLATGLARITASFLFCSLVISIFLYFKKERLLFKVTGVLALFLIIFGGVMTTVRPLSKYISQGSERLELKFQFLKAEAISNNDSEFCEEIKKTLEEKNISWWMDWQQKAKFMETYYESCVEEIAVNLGDETLCTKLLPPREGRCIRKVAIKKNNPQLCEKISVRSDDRDECFLTFINLTKNPDLCKKLFYPHERNNCIIRLSLRLNNPDLCREIEEKDTQEACYKNFKK